MRHPSKPAFQSIYLQQCFPIIPYSEYLFKKVNHQLYDKSLSFGTSESHQKISKDNDVPQSLIYGTNKKRSEKSQKFERKNGVIDTLEQNKILIYQG